VKKLYVVLEMTDEEWATWADGYDDPIDPLSDVAMAIDSAVSGLDLENSTVWGSLEDFLSDNALDAMAAVPDA